VARTDKIGVFYMENTMFLNDKDKEMYCFLVVLKQFCDNEITVDEFMQYIDEHTPPEHRNKHRDNNQTREERTAEIVNDIEQIQEHLEKTYFTGNMN
jgi:hypothetical protein